MRIAFFVSSVGDTDLAKATIAELVKQNSTDKIFIIPLTNVAVSRTDDLTENEKMSRVLFDHLINQKDAASKNTISSADLDKISQFVSENKIQRSYIGVPSIDNEIPFEIANHLTIPCTIVYEYMFKPANHRLWNYVDRLANKTNCDFVVPLRSAENDFFKINPQAKIHAIGHLSIDRSQTTNFFDSSSVRKSLAIQEKEELIFISGTTQPIEIDNQFLDALLSQLSTGNYPGLQLRMGLHPGVKDPDLYLQTLLRTCEKYAATDKQFKIILTSQFEKKLQQPIQSNSFILRSELSGAEVAQAADKAAQAVPGALLNEAALKGKPSYFHDQSAVPYLPREWFAKDFPAFFAAKPEVSHTREELGLEDSAPRLLAKGFIR